MVKYYYEYDSAGFILNTRMYNVPQDPAQTPDDIANSLHEILIVGNETQDMLDDIQISQGDPVNHKILTNKIKRIETLSPDSILSTIGFTPVPTLPNFQEFGSLATATDNDTDTLCHLTYPTPILLPVTGVDYQAIEVTTSIFDLAQTGLPSLRIEIYETGNTVPLLISPEFAVTQNNQKISYLWDCSALATVDGSAVEVKIFGIKTGGISTVKNTVNIGPCLWKCLRDTNM